MKPPCCYHAAKRRKARKRSRLFMDLSNVTVIIPAHNRPKRLRRLLNYYSLTNIHIIVADSSADEFKDASFYPHVIYRHYPEEQFLRKINNILPFIATPYVFYCADDDFTVPGAVRQMALFLDSHPEFVTAQGHYLTFEVKKNKVEFSPRYIRHFDKKIDAATAAGRLEHFKDIYASNLYSVIRTEVFRRMYTAVANATELRFRNLFLAEEYFNLFSLINGAYVTLPYFYGAREYIASSAATTTVPFATVRNSEEYKEEYSNFIDILATELARKDNIPFKDARGFILRTIDMPKINASISFKRKVLGFIDKFKSMKWLSNLLNERYKQKGIKAVKGMSSYPCKGTTPEIRLIEDCISSKSNFNDPKPESKDS